MLESNYREVTKAMLSNSIYSAKEKIIAEGQNSINKTIEDFAQTKSGCVLTLYNNRNALCTLKKIKGKIQIEIL